MQKSNYDTSNIKKCLKFDYHPSAGLYEALNIEKQEEKLGLSEERLAEIVPVARQYISFWREYPDLFIDQFKPKDSNFNFFFYQRVFLRAAIRFKYTYFTFTRAFSKSFLAILILMIRCILFPGAKLFIVSGTAKQATQIAKEKIDELIELFPFLKHELDWNKCNFGKDYVRLLFRNKSALDIVAARESTRGGRRHGGLMEEVILIDGQKLNEVILPLMNVSRRAKNGRVDPNESLNKSQIYVTTAGFKNTFAYDKLLQILIWQIAKPDSAFITGGSWRVPVMHKLLDSNFVKDLMDDGTYNEASFEREYESTWVGSVEDAFFNSELYNRHRILKQPEYESSGLASKKAYYVLSVDVGRIDCQTAIMVFKVTPQEHGVPIKSLVNLYAFSAEHFGQQAVRIKKLYYKYLPKAIVVDGMGMGVGLIDFLVKKSEDEITNEIYPPFGVINDEKNLYKDFKTDDMIPEIIYIIKADPKLNSDAHVNVSSQISSGKVKLLMSDKLAKERLLKTAKGKAMTQEQRANYLKPFTLTSILGEEMLNLVEVHEKGTLRLEPANKKIKHDKFSAFEYGLYYIKLLEDKDKKKKKSRLSDFMFFS